MTAKGLSVKERFWLKVDKSGGCWIWQGARSGDGYGLFTVRLPGGKRKTYLTHKFAFEQVFGEVPAGLYVCHHCDNPPCVNPSHLFQGTPGQNIKDSQEKGRRPVSPPRSEPKHRMDPYTVQRIRELVASGAMQTGEVSKEYGISTSNVRYILNGQIWANVGGTVRPKMLPKSQFLSKSPEIAY